MASNVYIDVEALAIEELAGGWEAFEDSKAATLFVKECIQKKWIHFEDQPSEDEDYAKCLFVHLVETGILNPDWDANLMRGATFALLAQYRKSKLGAESEGNPLPPYEYLDHAISETLHRRQESSDQTTLEEVPLPQQKTPAKKNVKKQDDPDPMVVSQVLNLPVAKIEITSFLDRRGTIYDTQTRSAATLSIQAHLENMALVDIPPDFIAGLILTVFESLQYITGDPRFILNMEGIPGDGRDGEQSRREAARYQQPATPPASQGNARPRGTATPQTPQQRQGQGRQNQPPPPAVMMKVDPDKAQIPNWEKVEQTRANLLKKMGQGQELLEVWAMQRIFNDQRRAAGLAFLNENGEVIHQEYDNSDPGDPETLFKSIFYKMDKGARTEKPDGSAVVKPGSLLAALKALKTNGVLYFNEPVFISGKRSTNGHLYVVARITAPASWSNQPFELSEEY